jgi:hypothetical protein
MRKIHALLWFVCLLFISACILNPVVTAIPTGELADTPTSREETVVDGTPYPTETPAPAIPAGFFPIAVGDAYNPEMATLIGGTENGVWIDAAAAAARLSGGETYFLYSPAGLVGTAVGTRPAMEEICGQFNLQWDPPPSATSLIGLGGDWNALPRTPEDPAISSFPTYVTVAGDWLASNGLTAPDPLRLTSVKRVDLDGDGTWEAIISASRLSENTLHDVSAGDFSMVLLLREAIPDTIQLAGDFYPEAKSLAFPQAYEFLSILDLSGDGRMEIIVRVSRWEGGGTLVFDFDGTTVNRIFDAVCSL